MSKLSFDVHSDILCRLPPKTLLRFRCLSKPCCSLIQSPDFIKLYLDHSIKNGWDSCCLIGQCLGKKLRIGLIKSLACRLWGRYGRIAVLELDDDLILFIFPSKPTISWVLEGNPWHMGNVPLVFRNWEAGLHPVLFESHKIPIWVKLKGVPLELLTAKGLSYIASAVGIPLFMDKATGNLTRISYAKVCVEADLTSKLIEVIPVQIENGSRLLRELVGFQRRMEFLNHR